VERGLAGTGRPRAHATISDPAVTPADLCARFSLPRVLQDDVRLRPLPDRSDPRVDPASLQPPRQPLTGDSHAYLLEPLEGFAESLGYSVSFESIPGATGGSCDIKTTRIVVDADEPPSAQLRALVHETTHALGIDYAKYTRAQSEVIVDTAVFSPCQAQSPELAGSGRR
jgi:hypothetical protein